MSCSPGNSFCQISNFSLRACPYPYTPTASSLHRPGILLKLNVASGFFFRALSSKFYQRSTGFFFFLCPTSFFATSLKVLLRLLHVGTTSPSLSSRCLRSSNLFWRPKKNFLLTSGTVRLSIHIRKSRCLSSFLGALV